MMTKHESDVSDPQGANQTQAERGGAFSEDRSKKVDTEQPGSPFVKQKEDNAAREKKDSGEQKR